MAIELQDPVTCDGHHRTCARKRRRILGIDFQQRLDQILRLRRGRAMWPSSARDPRSWHAQHLPHCTTDWRLRRRSQDINGGGRNEPTSSIGPFCTTRHRVSCGLPARPLPTWRGFAPTHSWCPGRCDGASESQAGPVKPATMHDRSQRAGNAHRYTAMR